MTDAWKKWENQVVNGKFPLREYLGGSENAGVFRTERGEPQPQKAAIKLIRTDVANAERQLSRWKQAAQLSHPHLLRLFDMGRCLVGGREMLFLVMEYAEENLSQVLPERALTLTETRDVLDPVLKALVFLHAKRLVHDRIKPANIMAVNDQVKLSSDGISPLGESSADGRKPGAYDPPERAKGAIAPPGDAWSLGMTLAEVLTRRRPAWENSLEGEPAVPATLPQPFFDIARHCLRRDPLRRWTVSDVQSRLHRTPPETPKQTPQPQWPLAIGRYAIPVVAAGILLGVLLAGGVLRKPTPQTQPPAQVSSLQPQVQSQPQPKAAKTQPGHPIQRASGQPQGSTSPPSTPTAPQPSVVADKATTGDVAQSDVVEQVLPDVPQSAKDTITGRVRVTVRVHVDSSGNVAGAEFQSPGPSKYFARLAMEAAQRWKFKPTPAGGEWNVRFEFGRTTTRAFPSPVASQT